MFGKMIYAEVTTHDDFMPAITTTGSDSRKGSCCCLELPATLPANTKVTLIANTHRAIIRVAEMPARSKRLSTADKWRMVEENFPLGPTLNADTHIFDGSIFENNAGKRCFMMVAIPKAIAEPIGEMAVEKWGSEHKLARLDTIEHMLFRHVGREAINMRSKTKETPAPVWVVFPQGIGFRILHIIDGLPKGAYYISDHPDLRGAELERAWESATPSHAVFISRIPGTEMDTGVPANAEEAVAADIAAGLRDSDDGGSGLWIFEFMQGRGLAVDSRKLCCMAVVV